MKTLATENPTVRTYDEETVVEWKRYQEINRYLEDVRRSGKLMFGVKENLEKSYVFMYSGPL